MRPTMTHFAAAVNIHAGGTTVASVTVSSALATDLIYTTITGETWLVIKLALNVSGAGTFIPRFAQSTDAGGTVTASTGSYITLWDSPN